MEETNARSKFTRICVFCGSNAGHRKVFSDAAFELGNELVQRKIDLVYGGGSVGLMGLISQAVYDGGCHVLGVIPKALMPLEISGETVGEVRTVSDMHERKASMAREADAFIALPGGYGTMEELLEMITWAQLGIHKKPVGLLNVDGYYNSLLALFDNGVKEGFIKPGARQIVVSAPTAKELMTKLEQYSPSHEHVASHESWQMEQLGKYPGEDPNARKTDRGFAGSWNDTDAPHIIMWENGFFSSSSSFHLKHWVLSSIMSLSPVSDLKSKSWWTTAFGCHKIGVKVGNGCCLIREVPHGLLTLLEFKL